MNGESRGVYRVLVGKPEGKRPLGKPRHRWEDNFKVDLKEIGWKGVDWIDLTREGQVAGHHEYDKEPLCSIKCGEFLDCLWNC
jgi:hypothetical protein